MTKKKRELIEILLDNITPDDWPVEAKFAAQDKKSLAWGKNKLMFYKQDEPPFVNTGETLFSGNASGDKIALPELCKHWSKTIVTRDEFVKGWNERIHSETNATTPPAQKELHAEETKPIQQVSAADTQIGGNHYTKLAIQPMRYSMENGLDALQHTVIKYVTRFRDKNGIEDLEKAKHCIDMLIEFERNKK